MGDVYDVLNELYALNQIVFNIIFEMDIYSFNKKSYSKCTEYCHRNFQ